MVSRTEKKLEESTCGVNIEVVSSSRGGGCLAFQKRFLELKPISRKFDR